MDTAVLKSWCEVVRRTDPLIWALAMDSSPSSQTENNIESLILSSSPPSPPSSPSLLASTSAAAAMNRSGSDTTAMDMLAAKTKLFSSFRNSHCKFLAVSQPQNAIDWLKCLVQTTTAHDDLHSKQDSHQHHLPRTMRRSVEKGAAKAPAGSLVVAMAMENVPKEEEVAMISKRTTGASSDQDSAPVGSTSNTGTASGSTGSRPGSPSSTSSNASGSSTNTHQRKTTNNNHNSNSNNTYNATTFNWMYYATEPVAASAAANPSTRFGSRNEDHAGTSSSTSSSGNAVGGGGAIISPSIATAATAAVASHIAVEREALAGGAAASAAATALSSSELQGSESTNNSDTLANSNNSMDSTITNNTIASASATATAIITTTTTTATTTTTTTTTPSADNNKNTQSLSARFTTLFPQASTITLASATQFLHSTLLSSKEATTAFLYRTFSPTYRICTLYKTSFTDGSQLRGLSRIKDSVMRADAVVLVKSSVGQMRDVCGMVMDAYGVKAKVAREKERREEREKAVKEGREIVEERIRSKKISEAAVTTTATAATATEVAEMERRKSVDDEGDDGSSSEGGIEDMGGGGLEK